MIMCLRKVNGLQKVRVVDAAWIWTEPHSMRLKIKLTIQKEVVAGAIIQQSPVVEFTIRNQQCKHCEASFATGAWHAIVQVRQRVPHKRTFLYLEQLILKNEAHSETMKIVVCENTFLQLNYLDYSTIPLIPSLPHSTLCMLNLLLHISSFTY